jgi:Domain of unknown function (DUF397)
MDASHTRWWTSTHCNANGCVEVAFLDDQIAIRDSKDRDGPILRFTPAEWAAFVSGVRDGEFDPARTF